MQKHDQISGRQFTALVFHFTIGSSILITPYGLADAAKQNAWLAALVGAMIGLCLVCLYNTLGGMHPQLNLAEYSEHILGKWLGKAAALMFFSFALLLAALVLRNLGDFITTEMMPETPIGAIHALMLLVVVMAIRSDLESLGRAAEIFFFLVTGIFILVVTLIVPHASLENMKPILGEGIKPIIRGSLSFIGTPFLELILFMMLFPYVNRPGTAKKSFLIGTALAGFWLSLATLMSVLGLSAVITQLMVYPTYYVVKKINVADFIQRVEAGLAVLWFVSIFFKLSICFYAANRILANILNLKRYRPLAVPLAMLVYLLSLIVFPNIAYFREFATKIGPFYTATFGLLLPLILLVVGLIRKQNDRKAPERRPFVRR